MSRRVVRFSLLSAVMFVAVRLVIGWHFYAEGISKFQPDSNWTSAGFLRAAVGPLAPMYQRYLPDDHRWEAIMDAPTVDKSAGDADAEGEKAASPVRQWRDEVVADWGENAKAIYRHYGFSEEQRTSGAGFVEAAAAGLDDYLATASDDDGASDVVDDYLHEKSRLDSWLQRPEEDVPYEQERIAKKKAELRQWKQQILAGVETLGSDLSTRIEKLATPDQQQSVGEFKPRTSLTVLDSVMKWVVLLIGVCCFVGAFTRVAMTVGGLFLLSVLSTQPPWIAGVVIDYKTIVEMVLMFALATTNVGKWGGLDYFLQFLFRGARSDAPGAG